MPYVEPYENRDEMSAKLAAPSPTANSAKPSGFEPPKGISGLNPTPPKQLTGHATPDEPLTQLAHDTRAEIARLSERICNLAERLCALPCPVEASLKGADNMGAIGNARRALREARYSLADARLWKRCRR